MINMEYKPGAIARIFEQKKNLDVIHSHHKPEDVMDLIQKGTFSELTEAFSSYEGCIAAFKESKKSIDICLKRRDYSNSFPESRDIAKIQVLTQGISSDTIMMGLLKKRIEQVKLNMFEQQDKSSESPQKTEEK